MKWNELKKTCDQKEIKVLKLQFCKNEEILPGEDIIFYLS
jgi:hypothetical protein